MLTPYFICCLTVAAVYALDRWEQRHLRAVFDWVPAILLAYVIPAAVSALLGEDYSAHAIHGLSRGWLIPLAIVTVMSSLSVRQLRAVGWRPIGLFVAGSAWIALFPVALIVGLGETSLVADLLIERGFWRGIPPIIGSWIGGSTSQLVLKEAVGCPEEIFLTVLVFDNLLVNVWTIIMFQAIKRSDGVNRWLGIASAEAPSRIEEETGLTQARWLTAAALLLSVAVTWWLLADFVAQVLVLSGLGLALGNLVPRWDVSFALRAGGVLILAVMAVLGLKLNFGRLTFEAGFLGFLIVWLVSHYAFLLLVAKVLRVHAAWVPIASMANVGGIATAPAVTAAYEKSWMPHAILLAILSMATGTVWGLLAIALLRPFVGG